MEIKYEKESIRQQIGSEVRITEVYLPAGEDSKTEHIGIFGQRHLHFIREHRKPLFAELLCAGKLNGYLADIDRQAEDMLLRLVDDIAASEGITERLKAERHMEWVQRMNSVRNRAEEIVNSDLICV